MATYWENSCSFGLRYVSWYKCLIVGLVFSHLGFWSGNLFLIAPFPDLCLLVPSYSRRVTLSYHMRRYAWTTLFPRNRGENMTENAHFRIENLFSWVPFRLSGVGNPVGFVVHTSAFTSHRSVVQGKLRFLENFNSNMGRVIIYH